jgi:hypothetical protein
MLACGMNPSGADMSVSANTLVEMLREIETADPIDFGNLPFGEHELRRLVVYSLVERHNQLEGSGMSVGDVHALYLLTAAKLVLENTVLHARLLMLQGQSVDVHALLSQFMLQGKSGG